MNTSKKSYVRYEHSFRKRFPVHVHDNDFTVTNRKDGRLCPQNNPVSGWSEGAEARNQTSSALSSLKMNHNNLLLGKIFLE